MVAYIPNTLDAAFSAQAAPQSWDFDQILSGGTLTGVQSGCAVTAQVTPDMTVAVAVGVVRIGGRKVAVTAGNVTLASDGTNPRWSLVTVDTSGTKAVVAGTAAATNPVIPATPSNRVALVAVYIPAADTSIQANQIIDKRITVPEPPWEDVKWYGAVLDLTANDTVAVQAAITAAGDNGTVLVSGRARLENATTSNPCLTLPGPRRFLGTGGTAGFYVRGTNNVWIMDPSAISDIYFENMTFDGDYPTRTSGILFNFIGCSAIHFDRCRVFNVPDHGIVLTRCSSVWFDRCRILNTKGAGVYVEDPGSGNTTEDIWFTRCHVKNWQQGAGPGVGAGQAGFQTFGPAVGTIRMIYVIGNKFDGNAASQVGIGLDEAYDSEVLYNRVKLGRGTDGEGIALSGGSITCSYNHVSDAGGSAGIMVWADVSNPCHDFTISYNHCWDNMSQGIALVWAASSVDIRNLNVSHNRCWDAGRGTQAFGIQAYKFVGGQTADTFTNTMCANNILVGNVTAPYDWAGIDILLSANVTSNLDPRILYGSGPPEGVVSAPPGSMWLRQDAVVGRIAYLKETGTGNTGWVPSTSDALTTLTSTVSVTNTATETNLLAYTIPAASVTVSTTYRIRIQGNIDNSATSTTLTLRLKIGANTLATVAITTPASAQTNRGFSLEAMFTVRTTGASGTTIGNISMSQTTSTATILESGTNTTQVMNTTAAVALVVSAQWTSANAANIVRAINGIISIEKA